jgi:hypothetical protein
MGMLCESVLEGGLLLGLLVLHPPRLIILLGLLELLHPKLLAVLHPRTLGHAHLIARPGIPTHAWHPVLGHPRHAVPLLWVLLLLLGG